MDARGTIHVVEDPRYLEHVAPEGHPECPERLLAVTQALAEFEPHLERLASRAASREELLRVHAADHIAHVERAARRAPSHLDPDTYISAESFSVACLAAGSVVELCLAVARGTARRGLAAVRPPGHHAERDRAMGFCLFNHVAVAARALQAEERVGKILILDWDVHHGNGTQHAFEDDPSVLYASTHQFPFYPGTGAATEVGRGRGFGATLNLPLPAGCGDAEYEGALRRLVAPAARAFRPDLILVSCGFDAHRDDPLASMQVSAAGFLELTRCVRAWADALCDGRLVLVLEGGYAPSGLREGTTAVLHGLLEAEPPTPRPLPDLAAGSPLRAVVDRVAAVHGDRIPDLGAA